MKYVKVETVLPENLIVEIQKYIQGEYIYVPSKVEKKKRWGENSGSRTYIQNRNEKIRNKYAEGLRINNLAEEFFLSVESIKKIIYAKNNLNK